MIRIGRLGVVESGALVGLVLAVLAGPARIASGHPRTRASALTAAIERVMRRASIPGALVGVWQRGSTPYVRAFGVRNRATGRRMGTNLYMRIGSETKTFVGTVLLQLVDQGKVKLDSPISSYLAGVPHGTAITIRQLADMRSGLLNYCDDYTQTRGAQAHDERNAVITIDWPPPPHARRRRIFYQDGPYFWLNRGVKGQVLARYPTV